MAQSLQSLWAAACVHPEDATVCSEVGGEGGKVIRQPEKKISNFLPGIFFFLFKKHSSGERGTSGEHSGRRSVLRSRSETQMGGGLKSAWTASYSKSLYNSVQKRQEERMRSGGLSVSNQTFGLQPALFTLSAPHLLALNCKWSQQWVIFAKPTGRRGFPTQEGPLIDSCSNNLK